MNRTCTERTEAQLEELAEVDELLSAVRVRFWLRGGWAVDFLLGEVTREHADLDLVAWGRHRGRIGRALTGAGFELVREIDEQTDWLKNGVEVSFVFLARTRDGRIVTHAIPEWAWREDALPPRRRRLRGRSYRGPTTRQPLRPKDSQSTRILRRIASED